MNQRASISHNLVNTSHSPFVLRRQDVLRLVTGGIGAAMLDGTLGGFSAHPVQAASGKISVYSALNESPNNAFIEAGCPIPQRGRSVLAQGLVARETLPWLQEVSQPFRTEITIADDVGIIRP
jgi:hypothetical protein